MRIFGLDITLAPGATDGFDGRMIGVAGGAALLLCRRAARMNRHAGQWALPGGRVDAGEEPLEAALREATCGGKTDDTGADDDAFDFGDLGPFHQCSIVRVM